MKTIRVSDYIYVALREASARYGMSPATILETILKVPIALDPSEALDGSVSVPEKHSTCRWCGRPFKQAAIHNYRYCPLHRDRKWREQQKKEGSERRQPLPMMDFRKEDSFV